jgi:hypothetical protein
MAIRRPPSFRNLELVCRYDAGHIGHRVGVKSYGQSLSDFFRALVERELQGLSDPAGVSGVIAASSSNAALDRLYDAAKAAPPRMRKPLWMLNYAATMPKPTINGKPFSGGGFRVGGNTQWGADRPRRTCRGACAPVGWSCNGSGRLW